MSAAAIKAGEAYVALGAKDTSLSAGLRKAQAQVKAFANGLTTAGMAMGGSLLMGGMAFAPVIQQFAEFEYAMARVKALSGATADEFGALEKEARRLGAETVFTAVDAAKAMGFFALAGYDTAKILKVIGPTLDMAAAGQMDLAAAADITTKILAGMGLEADQTAYAVDVLTKAMTTANTDLQMLGDAFKYVGPAAKAAGWSLEEVTAAIQLLSNAGIQGDMAGTTMRQILISLTGPSAEAADEMKRLGVNVKDALGNVRPLADILADLKTGLGGKGTGDLLTSVNRIFPARAATGATELIGQGPERLRGMTDALKAAGGTADRIAKTQMDTLLGTWKYLVSSVEGAAITIGKNLNPLLREWADIAGVLSNAIRDWAGENKELFVGIAKGVAAVAGLTGGLLALGVGLKAILFAGGTAVLLGKVALATAAVVAGLELLGPVGDQIRAGLGGAITFLGERLGWLKDRWDDTWGTVSDAVLANDLGIAWQTLATSMHLTWLEATQGIREAWEHVMGLLEANYEFLASSFDTIADKLSFLGGLAEAVFGAWPDFMMGFGEAALSTLDKIAERMQASDFVAGFGSAFGDFGAGFIDSFRIGEEGSKTEAQKRIDELREQLKQLREAAAYARNPMGPTNKELAAGEKWQNEQNWLWYQKELERLQDADIPGAVTAGAGKMDVQGTFDSSVAGRLGVGQSQADRTAAATEETARNTRKIADSLVEGGFA